MSEQIDSPAVVVLAGPNGAGKSTAAPKLLPHLLGVAEFVNADVIAQGLSAFAPERHALEAGRLMLQRLDTLAAARENFAFETTLASRSFAPRLAKLVAKGYDFHLAFFYLPSADQAVQRVAQRVRHGGHHVPEETIRRRYDRGLWNLLNLYIPLATSWQVYNNGRAGHSRLIAHGRREIVLEVRDQKIWTFLVQEYGEAQ